MLNNTINAKTFFFGALMGGIAGLLFAPKSGERLRKDICTACKQLSDDTRNIAGAVTDTVKDTVKHGKEKAEHLVEDAKEKVSEGVEKVKDGVHAAKKELKSHL